MTREEEIKNFANNEYKCIGSETDYTSTTAYEGIIKDAEWADANTPKGTSLIKWQTGEPKTHGRYLVQTEKDGIQIAIWSSFVKTWSLYNESEITAWCKLSDVEPYKE